MRLAVAATAPFGADVLERLAASHEIAYLLTRPDAPRGRGRKLAPPPAKETATRLGIPVHQPERPELPQDPVDAVVVCAYGLLIPADLLARALWLNVHPSLLPRWRGAAPVERAILAGDEETGVTIHETVKELDAGPIAAQEAFPIAPEDDAGAVFARSAEVAARLLDRVLPAPSVQPAARRRRDLRRQDRPRGPGARSRATRSTRGAACGRSPRTSAPGRRCTAAGVTVWKARLDGRRARSGRGAAGRQAPDGATTSSCAGSARDRARPHCGLQGRAPGLRGRGVRRPGDGVRRRRPRPARPGARPAHRLRHGAAHAHDRPRDRRAREPAGARARPARAGCAADRRLRDRLERGSAARRRQRGRRARPRRRASARDGLHECRRAPARRRLPGARRVASAGAARRVVPGLDLRDLGAGLGRGGGARADARAERARRARRPLRGPGRRADRHPRRVPPRAGPARGPDEGRIWQSRGSQLAGARGRLTRRRADPRRVRRARRQDDDAPRRGDRGRAPSRPRPRARGERPAAGSRRTSASSTPTSASSTSAASTVRSSTRRARASASSPAAPISAGGRPRCPALQLELLRAAAERTQPGGTVLYSVCTLNADENEAVVDALGPRAGAARRGVARSSRTRSGRSSC